MTTIRRITDESTEMTPPINLDALISAEISQHPEGAIAFMRTGCTVWADGLLSVVFTNLIRNSIKYGGSGVHIWISSEEADHEVTITVEDDGPGLSDDKKLQLFSLFQESTTERGGRGLGLHITRLLIRRYGGGRSDRATGYPAALRVGFPSGLRFAWWKGQKTMRRSCIS